MAAEGSNGGNGRRSADDPTDAVRALTESSVKRLDDLREYQDKITDMRATYDKQISDMRAEYDQRLRVAESARLDAIRAVDAASVQRQSEVSSDQAQALANQLVASAEQLRTQVSDAASAAQIALDAALNPMRADIQDLRRVQYETQGGKQQVVEGRQSNAAFYAAVGFGVMLLLALLTVAGFVIARS